MKTINSPMTPSQHQRAKQEASAAFNEAQQYCQNADMRLSRDPVDGYWLHFDGRMRFVRSLSDVRGTVDYVERWDA